jgi:DNA-binding SARP family transcriptional activator
MARLDYVSNDQDLSLREYIDMRFGEQKEAVNAALIAADKAVNAALSAADRAVAKAEIATEKRFDSVNEFRGALNDNARLLMPRAEAERAFAALGEKIEELTKRANAREEHAKGAVQGYGWLISILGAVTSVVTLIFLLWRGAHT